MRSAITFCFGIFLFNAHIMGQDKIQWSFEFNASRCLEAKAQIESGWHLYSAYLDPNLGPVPTAIHLEKNKSVKLTDPWIEKGKLVHKFDPSFGAEMAYFENEYAIFAPISIKKPTTLKGELTYMLCDQTRCLPPKSITFEIGVSPLNSVNQN